VAAVPCAECGWRVSPSADKCRHCRAPISVAVPPDEPELPPPANYKGAVVISSFLLAGVVGAANLASSGKSGITAMNQFARQVPRTQNFASGTIRMSTCHADWRACADNRDWVRNGDRRRAQAACLSLAEGAWRLGHFTWDRSRRGPRFDSYLGGASIRRGYIVLADHGALVRDGFGGWVHAPLHCTFDLVSRRALSLAPP